jgi:hypothetical protein
MGTGGETMSSSELNPNFHRDVKESELAKALRAFQGVCAQNRDLQMVLNSREPKYVPHRMRIINGKVELSFWYRGKEKSGWIPLLTREGEVTTKDYHDAIRQWLLGGGK